MSTTRIIPISEAEHIVIHGRTTAQRDPIPLFWTGSGIELNVRAGELWVHVESRTSRFEQWLLIEINDAPVSRIMLGEGKSRICVFRGFSPDITHQVRISKEVQPMPDDPDSALFIHAIETDGELCELVRRKKRIEFVGDSVTSGEGLIGARCENEWLPPWFSTINHYAVAAARALDADYRIISQSGWGVLSGWNNDLSHNLPAIYDYICAPLCGESNLHLGTGQLNDFAAWQPDCIVIALSANDWGAFNNPPFIDENGVSHKLRLDADGGKPCAEDAHRISGAVTAFLSHLRLRNPSARLLWMVYKCMSEPLIPAIQDGINAFLASHEGEPEIPLIVTLRNYTIPDGSRFHPGSHSHDEIFSDLYFPLRSMLRDS